jgi:hypothetical protein
MKIGQYGKDEGQLSDPLNLAVDWEGNILVADSSCNRISIFG